MPIDQLSYRRPSVADELRDFLYGNAGVGENRDEQRGSLFLVFAPSSRHEEGDDQHIPGQVSEGAVRLHCAHGEVVLGGVESWSDRTTSVVPLH